jgi:hypothetical protein
MIRARPNLANTPLIFLTTQSDDVARLKGYRLGVDDYLAKPFQGAELVARVERVLNRSRAQAGAGGNRALRGDLSHVALPSVLSLAEMERRTGSLLLVRDDETITLLLKDGAVVRIDLPARYADKKASSASSTPWTGRRGNSSSRPSKWTSKTSCSCPSPSSCSSTRAGRTRLRESRAGRGSQLSCRAAV